MYRAHKWNAAVSRACRESSRINARALLQKEGETQKLFARSNIVPAGRGAFNLVRFALSGVIATGASIGVAIFYAGRDEKIREELEKVPFAQQALSSIYGEKKKPEGHEQTPDIALHDTGFEKKEAEESLIKPPSEVMTESSDKREEQVAIEETENVEDQPQKNVEDQRQNKVIVITTIDDQAAVSSVDLDIGNATPPSNKKKKEKKKKLNVKEKKPAQKEEAEVTSLKGTDDGIVVATNSSLKATEVVKDDQISEMGASTETPQDPTIDSSTEEAIIKECIADEGQASEDNARADDIMIDKSTVEAALKKHMEELKVTQDSAIQKQADASEELKKYKDQLAKALSVERESLSFDDEWKAASDLEHISQRLMDDAKDSELKMQASIETMYKLIQSFRESGSNDIADLAQETATKASLELVKATDEIKKVNENILAISEQGLVKDNDVKKEISPLLDSMLNVNENNDSSESTKTSSNVLLTYAMKKIEFLKNDLEDLRIREEKRLQEMIQKVREDEEKSSEVQLKTQEELLKKEFEVLLQKKEADMLDEFEIEMRKQLKRQSAAHREHLADVVEAHTSKLNAEHKADLEEKVRREKLIHSNEMSKLLSYLRGFESLVDSIGDVEKKNRRTRELWLAVQSLNSVLNEELVSGRTKNLWPEISSIAKLAENNETIQFVLETIPESAAIQGVTTEEGLRRRFEGVKRICKRVAMVGDNEGSLWTYILSAIRSLLVFETHTKRDIVNEIDPTAISPYEILAKAQHCMEEGDLELAVKFMSLLKGLPRKLARDWLREAIVYLETKQASEFLLAYVASEASCDQSN